MPPATERRATVLTVLNLKGGVGKTHAVWLLASVCQERGLPILAIDTDTQGNLSNSFTLPRRRAGGVERLVDPSQDAYALDCIQRTEYRHIHLIPSSPKLAPFDLSDQASWEKAELHRSFIEPVEQLRTLYDFIVFDCPPRLSLVSFAALCASDFVIVPLEAADWGAQGIVQVTAAIDHVRARYNRKLQLLGYLVSRFKSRRAYQNSYLEQLRKHFPGQSFDTTIPDVAAFERSVTDAVPITLHSPSSVASSVARSFFDETCQRISRLRVSSRDDERKRAAMPRGVAA